MSDESPILSGFIQGAQLGMERKRQVQEAQQYHMNQAQLQIQNNFEKQRITDQEKQATDLNAYRAQEIGEKEKDRQRKTETAAHAMAMKYAIAHNKNLSDAARVKATNDLKWFESADAQGRTGEEAEARLKAVERDTGIDWFGGAQGGGQGGGGGGVDASAEQAALGAAGFGPKSPEQNALAAAMNNPVQPPGTASTGGDMMFKYGRDDQPHDSDMMFKFGRDDAHQTPLDKQMAAVFSKYTQETRAAVGPSTAMQTRSAVAQGKLDTQTSRANLANEQAAQLKKMSGADVAYKWSQKAHEDASADLDKSKRKTEDATRDGKIKEAYAHALEMSAHANEYGAQYKNLMSEANLNRKKAAEITDAMAKASVENKTVEGLEKAIGPGEFALYAGKNKSVIEKAKEDVYKRASDAYTLQRATQNKLDEMQKTAIPHNNIVRRIQPIVEKATNKALADGTKPEDAPKVDLQDGNPPVALEVAQNALADAQAKAAYENTRTTMLTLQLAEQTAILDDARTKKRKLDEALHLNGSQVNTSDTGREHSHFQTGETRAGKGTPVAAIKIPPGMPSVLVDQIRSAPKIVDQQRRAAGRGGTLPQRKAVAAAKAKPASAKPTHDVSKMSNAELKKHLAEQLLGNR